MIDYKCMGCGGTDKVEESIHIDPGIYYECECGELMLPINDNDRETMDAAQ